MKHESRPYTNLERKLEQLPGVDADHLWDDMHAILDKKMPEKREKRRFIVWFLNDRGLFSIGIALLDRPAAIHSASRLSTFVRLNPAFTAAPMIRAASQPITSMARAAKNLGRYAPST